MKYEKKDYRAKLLGEEIPKEEKKKLLYEDEENFKMPIVLTGESGRCNHNWRVHREEAISRGKDRLSQTIQWLMCNRCGQLLNINITTGEVITHIK